MIMEVVIIILVEMQVNDLALSFLQSLSMQFLAILFSLTLEIFYLKNK